MKTLNLGAALLFFLFASTFSFAQNTVKKETLKVWGNCGMCKKVIEKSALKAGATAANWNEDSKELKVSYASNKTTSAKIQESIAKSGYDTQDFTGDDAAYEKLPGCCHYDRKAKAGDAAPAAMKCCTHEGCGTAKDACKGMDCCKDGEGCKKAGMAMMTSKDGKAMDCAMMTAKGGEKMDCCKKGGMAKMDGKTMDCCKKDGMAKMDGKMMDCCKKDGKGMMACKDGKMDCCKKDAAGAMKCGDNKTAGAKASCCKS